MFFFFVVDVEVDFYSYLLFFRLVGPAPSWFFLIADLQPPYYEIELSEFQVFSRFLGGSQDDASLARAALRTLEREEHAAKIAALRNRHR